MGIPTHTYCTIYIEFTEPLFLELNSAAPSKQTIEKEKKMTYHFRDLFSDDALLVMYKW